MRDVILGALDRNPYDKQGGAGPLSPPFEVFEELAASEANEISPAAAASTGACVDAFFLGAIGDGGGECVNLTFPSDPRRSGEDNGSGRNVVFRAGMLITGADGGAGAAAAAAVGTTTCCGWGRTGTTDDSSPISAVGFAMDQALNASVFECMNAIIRRMANADSRVSSVFRAKDVWSEPSWQRRKVVKMGRFCLICVHCCPRADWCLQWQMLQTNDFFPELIWFVSCGVCGEKGVGDPLKFRK